MDQGSETMDANLKGLGEVSQEKRGWGIKEVITTVLFCLLIIVLQLTASMLSMFSADFAMIGSTAVACFIAGPLFVLMTIRVRKFGTTTILSLLTALVFCMTGNYWMLVPYYIVMGVIVDLILLKPEWRVNPSRVVAGWTLYSAMYVFSSIIPIVVNFEAYKEEVMQTRMIDQAYLDAYTQYFMSVEWVIAIVIITAIGGFLGAMIGKKMAKKHFEKAGVL